MKYLVSISFVFISALVFAQGKIWYGNVERLSNESAVDFVERIVIEEQDLEENDTIAPWKIMHVPVEIKFGLVEEKRIVFVFKVSGEYEMEIGILTPSGDNNYYFESFGNLIYGFPNTDEILSIFAFNVDVDIHPALELCIIGKGGVRTVNEDGMTGCCETIYSTDIYYEHEESNSGNSESNDYFSEFGSYQILDGLKTAGEVKAALHRNLLNHDLKFDKDIEKLTQNHFKKLDSIDLKYGIKSNRKVIDKIYKLDLGSHESQYVVSLTREMDGIEFYSLGIFTDKSGKFLDYAESKKVELNDYQNFKNYEVETIFSYDADQYGEIKYKEVIVLLSANEIDQPKGKKQAVFVGSLSNGETVYLQEGWHYGIHEEVTAAEIKKAVENYHNPKEDETPRD